jgi:hypothetical protein
MANEFRIKNGVLVDQGGASITGSSAISGSLGILSSGSNVVTVDGSSGRLFTINDSLSGSLFSVNTIAGLPVIEAFSDNTVRIGQYGQKALYVSQSKVGIGNEIPGGKFDITYGGLLNDPTILVGADDTGGNTRTNNTTKIARIAGPHYNNSATSSTILIADSNATSNRVFIGGGSAYMNAATDIRFFVGATTASLTGTEQMRISSGSIIVTSASVSITGSIGGNMETRRLVYGSILVDPVTDQNDYNPTGWNGTDPNKTTTINISSSNSVKITGLTGGVDGRVAIIRNVSPDRLVILEDSSSLSTAGNRFDFRNPIFLIPGETVEIIYSGYSSTWTSIGSSGGIGYSSFFNEVDDFAGQFAGVGVGSPFVAVVSGAAATASISSYLQNTTEKPLGIVQGATGTTTTGRVNIGYLSSSVVIPQQGQAICLSRVATQQLSTTAQTYLMYSGWHDSAVNPISASNGIFWRFLSGSSGFLSNRWIPAAASSSLTITSSIYGPVADLTYAWLGIYVDSTWKRATYFYSTDSLVWTITAEIASTAPFSVPTGFGVHIGKLVGTTSVLNSVDFLGHRYDISRG